MHLPHWPPSGRIRVGKKTYFREFREAGTTIDLVGVIGRLILTNLLPPRRLRTNARTVKRAISKYNARGPNIDRRTYQATIAIAILRRPD